MTVCVAPLQAGSPTWRRSRTSFCTDSLWVAALRRSSRFHLAAACRPSASPTTRRQTTSRPGWRPRASVQCESRFQVFPPVQGLVPLFTWLWLCPLCSTITSLGVLTGAQLFSLNKEELKTVCPDDGARVFSQVTVQKAALEVSRARRRRRCRNRSWRCLTVKGFSGEFRRSRSTRLPTASSDTVKMNVELMVD